MSESSTCEPSTNSLHDPRITRVVQRAADVAYGARVRSAVRRRIQNNTLARLLKNKNPDVLRQNALSARVTRHGIKELLQRQNEAGISKERWLALSSSTREAASPEEFQAFARVLGVSSRWLAIGSGPVTASSASSEFEEAPAGWKTFGSHVDQPQAQLEFSKRVGEDGLPLWERQVA